MARSPFLLGAVAVASAQLTPSQLQQAVNAAIASSAPSLTVPNGYYDFSATNFWVTGAANLNIDFSGSILNFYPGYGTFIDRASNVSVQNFTIDYSTPCFTQGIITGVNGSSGEIDVQLDPAFPSPDARVTPYFDSSEIKLQFWDAASRTRIMSQPLWCPPNMSASYALPGGGYRLVAPTCTTMFMPALGQAITISPRIWAAQYEIPDFYTGQTYTVYNSSGVTSSDVTILGGGNFAVLEWGGAGGHVYRRLTLTRPSDGRANLLSANCDGFHSFSVGAGPVLDSVHFAWQGDDAMNFHNRVGVLLAPPTSSSTGAGTWAVQVIDVGDVPSLYGGMVEPASSYAGLGMGEELKFFSPGEGGTLLGTGTVAGNARVSDPAVLAAAQAVMAAWQGVKIRPQAIAVWAITLSGSPPSGLAAMDVVQADAHSSQGGLVVNSTFEHAYDSCFRLQASGTRLANSTFSYMGGGVSVVYDPGWLEGSAGLTNIAITGNSFRTVEIGHGVAAANISQVLTVDAGVQGLTVSGNSVAP